MVANPLESSLCQLQWLTSTGSLSLRQEVSDKPAHSYSSLIRMAIDQSPSQKCTLSEIYGFISTNFPYYKTLENTSWKNSIRHNLSLNKLFVRERREPGDPGKGSYWKVDRDRMNKRKGQPASSRDDHLRLNPDIERLFTSETTTTEDLSASFRVLYNQLFDIEQDAQQVNWLKNSLETVGIEYWNEEEMDNVDMNRFREMVDEGNGQDEEEEQLLGDCSQQLRLSYRNFLSLNNVGEETIMGIHRSICDDNGQQNMISGRKEDEIEDDFDWDALIAER